MNFGQNTISRLLFSVVLIGAFTIVNAKTKDSNSNIYKRFSAVQCDSLVKASELNPEFVILDVRTPNEFNSYHLKGAINYNSGGGNVFDEQLKSLPKHKLYLLHCQSGSRSAVAFTKMKNLGFEEVYEMIGGISAWRSAGFPTTTAVEPKLMIVSVTTKTTKSAVNDTTLVTITNRANGALSFSNLFFNDEHTVQTDFDNLKTLSGAQDYTFLIVHQAGLGDTTKVTLESNGGNISFEIGNSLSTYACLNQVTELKLYPNPVSGRLFFDAGNELMEEIHISDLSGKIVLEIKSENNTENINVSLLPAGIYLARIKLKNDIITRKFVVKR
jgi:rhodanese-related sulfurtransferase